MQEEQARNRKDQDTASSALNSSLEMRERFRRYPPAPARAPAVSVTFRAEMELIGE